jgi:hypothetical protein
MNKIVYAIPTLFLTVSSFAADVKCKATEISFSPFEESFSVEEYPEVFLSTSEGSEELKIGSSIYSNLDIELVEALPVFGMNRAFKVTLNGREDRDFKTAELVVEGPQHKTGKLFLDDKLSAVLNCGN